MTRNVYERGGSHERDACMFSDVPIRFRSLALLFVIRTFILVPVIAGMTYLVAAMGFI